ncbi:MAG TPA: hypothetical protein VGC16_06895, partial [Rhizomicrobium sp.]
MPRLLMVAILALAAMPALGADYVRTENNKAYTLKLTVPGAAMAIAPLKQGILADWDKAAAALKQDAGDPGTSFALEHHWRVTFESPAVLSLSDEIYINDGGAYPNGDFE